MHLLEDRLCDYMVEHGVAPDIAQDAAHNCAASVIRFSAGGAVIGATAGALTGNPATLLMSAAGAVGGGAIGLFYSPSCSDVREAAYYWADSSTR